MASLVPQKSGVIKGGTIPFSLGMALVTLGVVYGDIGTSPLYVMKAVVSGNGGLASMTPDTVIGAVSLVLWTVMLITTVKYVLIALRADNHNEGGIFALFSLVKKCGKWLILPAMIGGAALLADGILTPAVTVTTAIEGLRTINFGHAFLGDTPFVVVLITVVILCALFLLQRAGTASIGHLFGPIMLCWFLFLGIAGILNLPAHWEMLLALNPLRGLAFLFGPLNKSGFAVLGFVFLATTGAEALYSDMGHVGRANIYATWPFVMICLFFNYLGQGSWIISNAHNTAIAAQEGLNPFFEMLALNIRPFAVVLSAIAGLIASQSLITGSYTLVSEATRLNLMPHLRITYPSQTKGQLYIPMVNNIMWIGTITVVLLFQTSYNMEAAYGLAITITMLMTTLLLHIYLDKICHRPAFSWIFVAIFGVLESCFFLSSLSKFVHGGYFTIIIAAILFIIMYIWRRGSAVERSQSVFLPVKRYIAQLRRLSKDERVPVVADNLIYLTNDPSPKLVDRDILFSILQRRPKRAKCYFFVNVRVTEEPYTHTYSINSYGTDFIFKITLHLGFKVNQRVNAFLHQIIQQLVDDKEMKPQIYHYSIFKDPGNVGDFKYVLLRKLLTPETNLSGLDRAVMSAKYAIRRICGSPSQWYGLATSSIMVEFLPLFNKSRKALHLDRVSHKTDVIVMPEGDEEDILSQDLNDDMSEVVAETEGNVIGGKEFRDRTGIHPKLVLDEEGRAIGVDLADDSEAGKDVEVLTFSDVVHTDKSGRVTSTEHSSEPVELNKERTNESVSSSNAEDSHNDRASETVKNSEPVEQGRLRAPDEVKKQAGEGSTVDKADDE